MENNKQKTTNVVRNCKDGGDTHISTHLRVGVVGAMVLGKLPVLGRPTILIMVWQGPTVLAVGVGRGGVIGTFFSPLSFLPFFSLSGRRSYIDLNTVSKGH